MNKLSVFLELEFSYVVETFNERHFIWMDFSGKWIYRFESSPMTIDNYGTVVY